MIAFIRNNRFVVCMLFLQTAFSSVNATTLVEAYKLALTNDPELKRVQAVYDETVETKSQSRARFLPFLDINAGLTRKQNDTEFVDPNIPAINNRLSTEQLYSVTLGQPLFHFDAFVQYSQSNLLIKKAQQELNKSKQDLIVRIAELYFEILAAQDNLSFASSEKEAIARQLEQTKQRFNVGLIAITDVHEAQARYDLAVAEEIGAENRTANAYEALRELTIEFGKVTFVLDNDMPMQSSKPNNIDAWVEMALNTNLQLSLAQMDLEISRSKIKLEKSDYYPTLDLVGEYGKLDYSNRSSISAANEISAGNEASITLRLNWNIYGGGVTNSKVNASLFQQQQTMQVLEKQRRATVRLTRSAYLGVLAGISRASALQQAVVSNDSALQATEAGYQVGTRTTVDVLNARTGLFRSQRDYAQSRYDYLKNTLKLKQAAGNLEFSDLEKINKWLRKAE